jgi:RNase P/RNase MRP subunit p29
MKKKLKLELVVTEILIGEEITAIFTDNESITFSGTVINETKNTIHLKLTNGSIKVLPKERIYIEKYYKSQKLRIKGSLFKGLPETRIKQEPRKFW